MKRHDLKCWPGPFEAVSLGLKTHEIRKDDRGFGEGDMLYLREWDPKTEAYSGRAIEMRVTYITRGPEWGIPEGTVVMSIDRASDLITDTFPPELEDPEVLADLLSLTRHTVPLEKVKAWTAEERKTAGDWAALSCLRASDHDDIVVPPVPEHVARDSR